MRLVVDTGIHREHWTRQQAIDYMIANTGMKPTEVVTEIERYIVIPGQACAYKVGRARDASPCASATAPSWGRASTCGSFHDVVLGNGSLPLSLLEQRGGRVGAGRAQASRVHRARLAMKLPMSWLREWVAIEATAEQVAEA